MFLKPTRSGGHTYLQLIESFRNESGQPRQRTVATLGRLDEVGGGVDSLLAGLLRHKGLPAAAASPPQLEFDAALSFGDVCALNQIWCPRVRHQAPIPSRFPIVRSMKSTTWRCAERFR